MENYLHSGEEASESAADQFSGFLVFREGLRIAKPDLIDKKLLLYYRDGRYDKSEPMTPELSLVQDENGQKTAVVEVFDQSGNSIGAIPVNGYLNQE